MSLSSAIGVPTDQQVFPELLFPSFSYGLDESGEPIATPPAPQRAMPGIGVPTGKEMGRLVGKVLSCTHRNSGGMTAAQARVMIEKIIAYRNANPGVIGKVEGKLVGIDRSFLITSEGEIFVLMTHRKTGEDIELGKGAYKKVKKTVSLTENKVYAVATFCWKDDQNPSMERRREKVAESEVKSMEQLKSSPGAVRLITSVMARAKKKLYLVMENCEEGDLSGAVRKAKLQARQKIRIAQECLRALAEMHQRGIIHRDIKHENIFLMKGMHAKIGDFGFACEEKDYKERKAGKGAPAWLGPEMIKAFESNQMEEAMADATVPSRDVWAMGEVLYFLFTGQVMDFQKGDEKDLIYSLLLGLTNADIARQVQQNPDIPAPYQPIIMGMLDVDPAKRFTAQQALDLSSI